jgi:hypothetical protein
MKTMTNLWRPILTINALLLAPLAFSQVSCTQLECGTGTIEKDGVCVLPDDARPNPPTFCTDGTHYDDGARGCVADYPPTVCQEGTTEPSVGEDGVIVCEGRGGAGCDTPCPMPAAGKVSMCGYLIDAQTDEKIADDQIGTDCSLVTPRPTTGPCSIEVQFYDALAFAGNPTGTPPLSVDEIKVNSCGRFTAKNLPAPATGFMAIGVDDYETAPDNYVLGGVAIPATPNLKRDDLEVYAVRVTTDNDWTTSAGQPFGATTSFGDRGAYLPIFRHKGTPIAGVVVVDQNNQALPTKDYYFSDADPFERTMIAAAQDVTGANGSGIVVDTGLMDHSGSGSEDMLEGCVWPKNLAVALAGVYFVQPRDSVDAMGNECVAQ